MKKRKLIATMMVLAAISLSCQSSGAKKAAQTDSETASAGVEMQSVETTSTDYTGSYVNEAYAKRSEGYDWVGVKVSAAGKDQLLVQVRSRADKKRPTCTWDATARSEGDGLYSTKIDGKKINFAFGNNMLTISAETEEGANALYFFCSGGASLAGTYTKIDGELDPGQVDPTVFSKVLQLQGIGFNVSSVKKDGQTEVTIAPFGLEASNRPETQLIDGKVVDAEVEDLNADGSPELMIYTQSEGSGSYGNVIAYSVNNKKSMSMVYFPPVAENDALNEGYMGHDEFRVVENSLVQRFPIYKDGDTNANPTGGMRQISYKLASGEAMRSFKVDKISTFGQ